MEKAWLLRPNPHHIHRMREFLDEGIIAIGWPELGSLIGKAKEDIRTDLMPHPYTPDQRGTATSTINRFVNEMRINDIVVIPDGDKIYFCSITSDYFFDPTKSGQTEGYPHQRKAKLLKGPKSRENIPLALRQSLRAPRALADLSHHINAILDYIGVTTSAPQPAPQANADYAEFDYPVRLDKIATIKIPVDITQAEAVRLSDFVKTLYF